MIENCTQLKAVSAVSYGNLNSRQKELFNFQKLAATFADYGFNCIKLADDWLGADFIAYNVNSNASLKVQLKSRITIDQKYSGKEKDIWMAFPHDGYWYLIKHDRLVEKVGKHTNWLNADAWKIKGLYHSTNINPVLLKSLDEDKLGSVYGYVLDVQDA